MKQKVFCMDKYKEGYVAFVDILGFKNWLLETDSEESNFEKTKKVFSAINHIRHIVEDTFDDIELGIFSDSFVLATTNENYQILFILIKEIEEIIYKETHLLLRGGIVKGKYYIKDNIVFGPAIVKAYEIESSIKYPRIGIDEDVLVECENDNTDALLFVDFDGKTCVNTFAIRLIPLEKRTKETPEEIKKSFFEKLENIQKEVKDDISCYIDLVQGKKVIDKYYWRITPFNKLCDVLFNEEKERDYFMSEKIKLTKEEKQRIKDLKINIYNCL